MRNESGRAFAATPVTLQAYLPNPEVDTDYGFTGHSLSRFFGKHLDAFKLINPASMHCVAFAGLATSKFFLHLVWKNQESANMLSEAACPDASGKSRSSLPRFFGEAFAGNGRIGACPERRSRFGNPVLGRFLSPDPVLQFPNYTQGLNPYAYALNNPLSFTDPSGYSLVGNLLAISLQMIATTANPILGVLVFSVVMTIDYAIENGRSVNIGDLGKYFAQTFAMSVASMGTTKVIGSMFDQMKKTLIRELGRAAAHGVFNGVMRMIQGGKFEHGFLSGFVSSLGGSAMMKYGGNMDMGAKVALSAALGGTAEALGGGKFANGAVTGAYVMMFNHLMEQTSPDDPPRKVDAISGNSHDSREPIYFELDEHFVDENTTYFFHKDTSVLYCIKVETQYYYLNDLETMGYVPRVNNPTTSIGFKSFYALMNLSANVWSPPGFPWTTTTTAWTNFVNMRRKTVVYETRIILNDE